MLRLTYGAMALCALYVASAVAVHAQDYKKTVIYQIVTDRFYDGSTSNDNPSQSAGLYDSQRLCRGREAEIPTRTGRPIGVATCSAYRTSSPTSKV